MTCGLVLNTQKRHCHILSFQTCMQLTLEICSTNLPRQISTIQRITCSAHLLCIQHCQEEPIFCPVSQQVPYLRAMHVCGESRSIKLSSLWGGTVDSGIPNFGQLFHVQIAEDWGHLICGLVLRYDQNVLIGSIVITQQNRLVYYSQSFHSATSDEHLGLHCKRDYSNANQEVRPEFCNISIQSMETEQIDLDITLECHFGSFLVL